MTDSPPIRTGPPRLRLTAVIAVAAVVGVVVWLAVGRGGNKSPATSPATTVPSTQGPVAETQQQLASLAQELKQPIYWAGAQAGYSYELTRTANGSVYVRYLPAGVKVGDKRASFLIVATYPYPNAYAALKAATGGEELTIPHGGLARVFPGSRKSVHVAFPSSDYQAEVYDPSPAQSLQVAKSGLVAPVG